MSNKITDLYKKVDARINNGEKLTPQWKEAIFDSISQGIETYTRLKSKVDFISGFSYSKNNVIATKSQNLIENIETLQLKELEKFIDWIFDIEKIATDTEEKIKETFQSNDDNQLPPPPEQLDLDISTPATWVVYNWNEDLPPPPTEEEIKQNQVV